MRLDLIVPTVPGREELLERCLASFPEARHIVIRGEQTCGAGWLAGLAQVTGDYVMLCADDIEAHPDLDLDAALAVIDQGRIPAPIVYRPDGSLESAGGDMSAPGCLIDHVQAEGTPVSFTPLPLVSREQAEAIGMIPAHYMTDVYLSHRGAQLGWPTVLCHGYRLIHHHAQVGRRGPSPADRRLYQEALNG